MFKSMILIFFLICYLIGVITCLEGSNKETTINALLWPIRLTTILVLAAIVFLNIVIGLILGSIKIRYNETKLYDKIDNLI